MAKRLLCISAGDGSSPLLPEVPFAVTHVSSVGAFSDALSKDRFEMVVVNVRPQQSCDDLCELARLANKSNRQSFVCVFGERANSDPRVRIAVADKGAAMTSASAVDLRRAADIVFAEGSKQKEGFACPFCGKGNLSEDELWKHCPMFHLNEKNKRSICPVCKDVPRDWIQVHIRNCHGPVGRGEIGTEYYPEMTLYAFSLVVCRRESDGKFLLVQEFMNQGFWLPGGRVDPGEGLREAALRETREEAGVDVELTGVLSMEFSPHSTVDRSTGGPSFYARMRVIFMAKPKDPKQDPKTVPDFDSVGAAWVSAEEIESGLRLRGDEPLQWSRYLMQGGQVFPLSVLHSR